MTCAGYYGTGSSAVTDYVREFNSVCSTGSYELKILHDIGGVRDLEYYIVENYNRHNSGHALKNFKKNVDFYAGNKLVKKHERYFDGNFKKFSYELIEDLTYYKFQGYWHVDLRDKGWKTYFRKRFKNKLFTLGMKNKEYKINELPNEITYGTMITEDEFLKYVKNYTAKLVNYLNYKENKKHIFVDQLLPSSNLKKISRYFDEIKCVVVDRDPRDIYILEKYFWNSKVIPQEVDVFCRWFKATRQCRVYEKLNTEYSILIQFEDLIYDYENTTSKIKKFYGLGDDEHVKQYCYFNPEISKNNTRLYSNKKYEGERSNIEYIERELSEFLYVNTR